MKNNIPLTWLMAIVLSLPAAGVAADDGAPLKTQQDRDSYAIGADLAKNLKRQGAEVETEPLLLGMRDALAGEKMLMTEDELRETLRAYQLGLRKKMLQTRGGTTALAEVNRQAGADFLTANKANQGVVTLPSGLQYTILKTGDGSRPVPADTVEYHFRGSMIDGTEFNSSHRTGKPLTVKVGEAIPGMKEALLLMPVGSKWKLYIPSTLAYGEKGVLGSRNRYQIPPNAAIVLEIELLDIKPSPELQSNTPAATTTTTRN